MGGGAFAAIEQSRLLEFGDGILLVADQLHGTPSPFVILETDPGDALNLRSWTGSGVIR